MERLRVLTSRDNAFTDDDKWFFLIDLQNVNQRK